MHSRRLAGEEQNTGEHDSRALVIELSNQGKRKGVVVLEGSFTALLAGAVTGGGVDSVPPGSSRACVVQ